MEIELDDRVVVLDEEIIVKIQALWRGALVRLQFKVLKNSYESLFKNLEENFSTQIHWPASGLCKPELPTKPKFVFNRSKKTVFSAKELNEAGTSEFLNSTAIQNHTQENHIHVQSGVLADTNLQEIEKHVNPCESDVPTRDKEVFTLSSQPVKDNQLELQNQEVVEKYKTSVWENVSKADLAEEIEQYKKISKADLDELRSSAAMELLWVQQAIKSRKQYLCLKKTFKPSEITA